MYMEQLHLNIHILLLLNRLYSRQEYFNSWFDYLYEGTTKVLEHWNENTLQQMEVDVQFLFS